MRIGGAEQTKGRILGQKQALRFCRAQQAPGQPVQGVALRQIAEPGQGRAQAFPQFSGGAAGKGDGQQLLRRRAFFQQALQATDEHAGFARAGTGQNQYRAGTGPQGRFLLFGECHANRCIWRRMAFLFRRGPGQVQKREAALRGGRVFARASGPGQPRQALAAARIAQFIGRKHAHHAILAVKAALPEHLAAPHAGHGFAQRFPVGAQARLRQTAKNVQLRPQFAQQAAVAILHLARAGANAQDFAHHFRQGNQGAGLRLQGQFRGRLAVGQFQHAVQHAHGQGLAADRADIVQGQSLTRFQRHIAGPMPVQMVFALLRIKFHGAQKAAGQAVLPLTPGCGAQGREHARIGGRPGEKIGLAPQVGPGMGIGIGDQGVAVQAADEAVHGRVRGKTGFQGENMFRKVGKAVFQPVKAGFGAEQGKPGRPDMGGDQHCLGHGFQHDFQQVARVQPQNGPSVGIEIADLGQAFGKAVRAFHIRHKNQVVHLAHFAVSLVNGADFRLKAEQRPRPVRMGAGLRSTQNFQLFRLAFQTIEAAGLVKNQLFPQFRPPLRMGEIAGSQHIYALAARPGRQMAGGERLAGGAGKTRMDVQIRNKIHV